MIVIAHQTIGEDLTGSDLYEQRISAEETLNKRLAPLFKDSGSFGQAIVS